MHQNHCNQYVNPYMEYFDYQNCKYEEQVYNLALVSTISQTYANLSLLLKT